MNCVVVVVKAGGPVGNQGGAMAAQCEQGDTPLHGALL